MTLNPLKLYRAITIDEANDQELNYAVAVAQGVEYIVIEHKLYHKSVLNQEKPYSRAAIPNYLNNELLIHGIIEDNRISTISMLPTNEDGATHYTWLAYINDPVMGMVTVRDKSRVKAALKAFVQLNLGEMFLVPALLQQPVQGEFIYA